MLVPKDMTAAAEALALAVAAAVRCALPLLPILSAPRAHPYGLAAVSDSQPWPGSEYDKTDAAESWAALFCQK